MPTTDVALADLGGEALALFNGLLASALLPLAARTFGESRRFRVHDAFLVKYDAAGGQVDLPVHADQAHVSLTVALNGLGDYDGGGTRFEAADGTARRATRDLGLRQPVRGRRASLSHGVWPLAKLTERRVRWPRREKRYIPIARAWMSGSEPEHFVARDVSPRRATSPYQ